MKEKSDKEMFEPEIMLSVLEDLKEKEEKYRSFIEDSLDGFWIVDFKGRILEVNKAYCKMIGYSMSDLQKMSIADLEIIESPKETKKRIDNIKKRGFDRFETKHKRKDGKIIDIDAVVRISKDKKYLYTFMKDITEKKKAEEKIKESEANLKEAQEIAHVGSWYYDTKTRVSKWSDQMFVIFGIDPKDDVPDYDAQQKLFHPEDLKELNKAVSKAIEKGTGYDQTVRIVLKDNSIRFANTVCKPKLDNKGEVVGLIGTFQDITDKKKADEEIIKTRNFYKEILSGILDGVWVANKQDVIYYANESMGKIAGIRPEEIEGVNVLEGFPKPTLQYFGPHYEKAKSSLKNVHYDAIPVTTPVGRKSLQSGWLIPINKEGKYDGMICTVEDVTEKMKIEDNLRESEALHRKAQIITHIGHWKLDPKNLTIEGSDELFKIFGLSKKEANLDSFSSVVHPEDREYDLSHIKRGMEKGIPWDIEHRLLLKDGTLKYIRAKGEAIKDNKGKVLMLLGTVQDITDMKKAESALIESEEKYRTLYNSVPNIITVVDEDFFIKDINFVVKGLDKKEVIGKKVHDFVNPKYHKSMEQSIKKTIKTGKKVYYQSAAIGPNSTISWYDNYVSPVLQKGKVKSVLIVGIDTTEKKKAEEKIEESEQKYRLITENVSFGVCAYDETGQCIYTNQQIADMVGATKQDVLAQNYNTIASWKPSGLLKSAKLAIKLQKNQKLLINLTTTFGKKIWLECTFVPYLHQGKKYVMLVGEDISERRNAEEKKKEEQARFRALVDSATESVILMNPEYKVLAINDVGASRLGKTKDEIIGSNIMGYMPKDIANMRKKFCTIAINSRKPINFTDQRDGMIFENILHPIFDSSGKINSIAVYARDITDQKKKEETLKKKLLKYNLEDGRLYFLKEIEPILSISAFNDLLKINYKGIFISRSMEDEIKSKIQGKFSYKWISETGKDSIPPDIPRILDFIDNQSKNTVIYIDRLDYLLAKTNFKEILSFIQKLKEIAYIRNLIIIVTADPSTFESKDMRFLEKEGDQIKTKDITRMPEDLLEILRDVFKQNSLGVKPSLSAIGIDLNLSKPTVRKHIRNLVGRDYLVQIEKGRTKVFELTEKGRNLFNR